MSKRKRKHVPFKALPKEVKIRKVISLVISGIAVVSLGYFAIYCYQASHTQSSYEQLSELKDKKFTVKPKQSEKAQVTVDDIKTPDILDDYKTLYNNNKSLIGWIKIDDTLIDYPVMQSSNNDYYLDHNFNQEKDRNGSIFIDKECSIFPRSNNIIIYGHNMKSGKMFGQLKKYKDKSYCEKHPYIYFDTLYEKGKYKVMYVFGDVIYDTDEITFKYYQFINANSQEEWESAMNYMAEKSLYETDVWAVYGDDIITLSTCDYGVDSDRFVVVAKKVN